MVSLHTNIKTHVKRQAHIDKKNKNTLKCVKILKYSKINCRAARLSI